MLSNSNIRTINRQIENELRTASSICSSAEEKLAALDRVTKLKSLFTEQSTTPCDIDQIATLVVHKLTAPPKSGLETVLEAMFAKR